MIRSLTRLEAPNRLRMLLALLAVAAAAAVLAACGSSGSSSAGGGSTSTSSPAAATAGSSLKTATIGGAAVLTDAQGFAVYSFAPDTMTKSDCTGACAAAWPPVKGPATAGAGLTGKLGTIKRSDGSAQATYNGHPLYTFVKDTGPSSAGARPVRQFVPAPRCPAEPRRGHHAGRAPGPDRESHPAGQRRRP